MVFLFGCEADVSYGGLLLVMSVVGWTRGCYEELESQRLDTQGHGSLLSLTSVV